MSLAFILPASAAPQVDVNQGNLQPLPIAIPDFSGAPAGASIAGVVRADLERSGLFKPLDPRSFLDKTSTSTRPISPTGASSMHRRW